MTSIFTKMDDMTGQDPLIGEQLGDYRIVGMIGKGGMGRVYRGYDEKLERYAAVKVFDAQGVLGDEMEEYRQRFQREARAIARLHHPNIVGVYQFGQTGSLYYMAMVMIEGRDLRDILKEYVRNGLYLPSDAVVRIMTDVASALDYAHQEGVIHRDIKPSNIMITADGHAVLTDFGLALNVPEGTIGSTFGTAQYIAPEQALNSAMAVPQSDLYSLGVVLYEMLTGKVPFQDDSAMAVALKHLSDPPPSLRLHNPDISYETEAVVLRVLDKDPTERYENGSVLMAALEKALGVFDEDELTRHFPLSVPLPDGHKTEPILDTEPTPLPALNPVEDSTVSDEVVVPRRLSAAPVVQNQKSPAPPRALIGLVAVAVVVMGAILLLGRGQPDASGDDVPVILNGGTEASATSLPATREIQPTQAATQVAALIEASATRQPTSAPSATSMPTVISAPVENGGDAIELFYDSGSLTLRNASDGTVDISRMNFVQVNTEGDELSFEANRWNGGTVSTTALPPGDCFQVWTTQVGDQDAPAACGIRHKWEQTSFPHWFWISETPGAVFEVRFGDKLLAQCPIDAGECRFSLDASQS